MKLNSAIWCARLNCLVIVSVGTKRMHQNNYLNTTHQSRVPNYSTPKHSVLAPIGNVFCHRFSKDWGMRQNICIVLRMPSFIPMKALPRWQQRI